MRLTGFMTESQLKLLAILRDEFGTNGASTTRLLEASNLTRPTYYRTLQALKTKGLITEQRSGNRVLLLPASLDGQQEVSMVSTGLTTTVTPGLRSHPPLRGETDETNRPDAPGRPSHDCRRRDLDARPMARDREG